jgi:hypothetical protein
MIKMEDLPLVHIRIHGKSGEVSLIEEPEVSLEEWKRIRDAAFARLRKTIIPHELVDLVENFGERTLVRIVFYKTSDGAGLQFGIKPTGKRMQDTDESNAITASEALAFFLRVTLRDLKYAEKKRKAAPVRTSNLVPRSVTAEIAMGLLDSCEAAKDAPGPFLTELFRELLNVGTDKHGEPRQFEAQEQAASIVAQYPTVPTRALARVVKVNPSTVSRWRRSSEFQARVEEHKQIHEELARMKKSDEQPR